MGLRSARATAILLPLGMLFRFETLFVTDSPSTHPLLVPRRPLGSAFPRHVARSYERAAPRPLRLQTLPQRKRRALEKAVASRMAHRRRVSQQAPRERLACAADTTSTPIPVRLKVNI
ncbi:hypothetical protein PsYK624_115380 [Phanerochaete sordida]|uniref:Secreted protein n=1 Tax=Phanerochaete sordida TaxID=48140 RepID=A0A9P3GJE7_9APHY|nr:hypothetical protein PsYK624_115380 [Phanerochaete sordida]